MALIASQLRLDIPVEDLLAAYAPPPSKFIVVQGIPIHYRDEGTGPVLVLLHGMFSSLHTWDDWVVDLRQDYRVVRLDLPGFGLSGNRPDGNYTAPADLALIHSFIDSLEIDRFVIVGNSMGGALAWQYALDYQDQVQAMILVDAAGYPGGDSPVIFKLARLPMLGELLTYMTPRWIIENNMRSAYGDGKKMPQATVERYHKLILRAGNRKANLIRMRGQWVDRSSEIVSLALPTLIIWGAEDSWIDLSMAEHFAADLPHATLIIYDGVGHAPMEEAPDISVVDVRRFLKDGY